MKACLTIFFAVLFFSGYANYKTTPSEVDCPDLDSIEITIDVIHDRCQLCVAEIAFQVKGGGTAPYRIYWSSATGGKMDQRMIWLQDSESTAAFTGAQGGVVFDFAIYDANDCILGSKTVSIEGATTGEKLEVDVVTTMCEDDGMPSGSIDLTVTGGNPPYAYNWGPDISSSAEDQDDLCTGLYEVTITDANGCVIGERIMLNQPLSTSTTEESYLLGSTKVYPNPAQDLVHIQTDNDLHLFVINNVGQQVFDGTIRSGHTELNTTQWPSGLYFLQFEDGTQISTDRILINK